MNEKAKEMFLFMAIGCAGVVGMEIAVIIATLIMEGTSKDLICHTFAIISVFFWAMLWGAIAYKVMKKKDIAHMEISKREKIITTQLYIITGLITIVTMVLIAFIIKGNKPGMIFSGAFLFALCFWETGCYLAERVLNKEEKK